MKLADFNYHLPPVLIATEPAKKRDQSRLLVLDKVSGKIEHKHFFDLLDYLQPGDLLVANNSKVIPARLLGKKSTGPSASLGTGGKIEVFLSKKNYLPPPDLPLQKGEEAAEVWECLIKGRVKAGTIIVLSPSASSGRGKKLRAEIVEVLGEGISLVKFNLTGAEFMKEVEKIGHVPLPPYIVKARAISSVIPAKAGIQSVANINKGLDSRLRGNDKEDYQTVYAEDLKKGSVAAPTAGLHFTPELIKKIKAKGVGVSYLTLHVGLGTFLPVKTENIEEHKIHSEYAEIPPKTWEAIIKAKANGKRVIAVGTTTARTLEYFADEISNAKFPMPNQSQSSNVKISFDIAYPTRLTVSHGGWGNLDSCLAGRQVDIPKLSAWADIFIYPPYKFKVVDALVTNFHLPKSTLLMLVSALATKKHIDKAYQEAIKAKYRFYSYGDAMFIT